MKVFVFLLLREIIFMNDISLIFSWHCLRKWWLFPQYFSLFH
jgi:hypothetical protein